MTAKDGGEVDRGPNGIPYVDEERFSIGGWESGDYRLKAARDDGKTVVMNFTPNQMRALQDQIEHIREEHEGADHGEGENRQRILDGVGAMSNAAPVVDDRVRWDRGNEDGYAIGTVEAVKETPHGGAMQVRVEKSTAAKVSVGRVYSLGIETADWQRADPVTDGGTPRWCDGCGKEMKGATVSWCSTCAPEHEGSGVRFEDLVPDQRD